MTVKNKIFLIVFFLLGSIIFSYSLTINGLNGSLVYLNNRFYGTITNGSLTINNLNSGDYNLKIDKSGYAVYEEKFNINENMIINVNQNPLAILIINSNVTDFDIVYNYMGRTIRDSVKMNRVNIPANVGVVNLVKDGFHTEVRNVNLIPFLSTTIEVNFVEMRNIIVRSNPSNAQVFYSHKYIGNTPIEFPSSRYDNISIRKEGYLDKNINLKDYENQHVININLDKGVPLSIKSNPDDSMVYIDGKYYANTPMNIDLAEGKYNIEIRKLGYEPKKLDINLTIYRNFNEYLVNLNKNSREIKFLNSDNYEFNIDGTYLGKGIDRILLSGNKHILRISGEGKIYNLYLNEEFPDVFDFNKESVLNVYSRNVENVNIVNQTKRTPASFYLNVFFDYQTFNLRTINRNNIIEMIKNGYNRFFLQENIGVVNLSSNSNEVLYYINNTYIGNEPVFGYALNEGVHEIRAVYKNNTYNKTIRLNSGEEKFLYFKIDEIIPLKLSSEFPLRVNSRVPFNLLKDEPIVINYEDPLKVSSEDLSKIEDDFHTEFPYFIYVNKGPVLIELNEKKIVVFIYRSQYFNLDYLF